MDVSAGQISVGGIDGMSKQRQQQAPATAISSKHQQEQHQRRHADRQGDGMPAPMEFLDPQALGWQADADAILSQ